MPVFLQMFSRQISRTIALFVLAIATLCHAGSIRGTVTDTSGTAIHSARVTLISNGQAVGAAVSSTDGSFEILTGNQGRFFLITSASGFRQLETPSFYASQMDSVERSIVLEPEWVRESIVVTATGTPTPQPQTGAATSVLGPADLNERMDLSSSLRLMPGTSVSVRGQLGAATSLSIRGGNSDSNKTLLDGISIGDMGGQFDFGPLSTTAIERAEIYRGPDSSIYGNDAASGVVSLVTPHGTTQYPSILFEGDAGTFATSREQLEIAGAHHKLDYLGALSWLQSGNDILLDEYHVGTGAVNLGWQLSASTQIRLAGRYGVSATGLPGAWNFYHVSDIRKQGDQDLYAQGSIDNQTSGDLHNRVQFGVVQKREQSQHFAPAGICIPAGSCVNPPANVTPGNYYGLPVLIHGANGYSAMGPALLDQSEANNSIYPSRLDLVNNRNEFLYQGDFRLTPHLQFLAGFHYDNERAAQREPVYFISGDLNRTNYDYLLGAHGDFFKERVFYTLGADDVHLQRLGNSLSPHFGLSGYAVRPRQGIFSGTRLLGIFAKGIREPNLTDEFGSLYDFLNLHGGQSAIKQDKISPIQAPATRTWEAGGEQAFWNQHILFRASYFHNEFGREIEGVPPQLLGALLPNLAPADLNGLISQLESENADSLDLNSLAFRAQGIESTVESGIGKSFFLRGGYTYLDSVVQRSFSSDNETAVGILPTLFEGIIPTGVNSPLKGARPFRRPPHTGFFTASYAGGSRLVAEFASSFSSRSDDSTFLGNEDINQGNSLVLPNRNLDWGFAKLDFGGSLRLLSWVSLYGMVDNLTGSQHIAPIGYPSLPRSLRVGLRIQWTKTPAL